MVVRKCQKCGSRNYTENPYCSSCGESLIQTPIIGSSPEKPQRFTSSSQENPKKTYSSSPRKTSPTKSPSPPPKPNPPSPVGSRPSRPKHTPTPHTSFPSPYTSSSSSPIPVKSSSTSPTAPFSSRSSSTIFVPLPSYLAKLSYPQVEGEVILERTSQIDKKDSSGWLRTLIGIVMLPFKPVMVLLAWIFGGNRPKEKKDIYIIRIEESTGNIVETRFEDELKGTMVSVGDYVSVWGVLKYGVLYIKEGFNHTTGGLL